MPRPTRSLAIADVRHFLRERCILPTDERRVGLEVEWLTVPKADPRRHVPFHLVQETATATSRPGRSVLTFEPGGQIELSSPPAPLADAIDAIRADAAELAAAFDEREVGLLGGGMDGRPVRRVRDLPRYRAMEAFFDVDGFAGRRMMNATAAIQVNVDAGTPDVIDRRWLLAHRLAPTLAAMFANSPMIGGEPSEWRSARMANWWAIDPTRTAPVRGGTPAVEAWCEYALAANVMFIRCDADDFRPLLERMPLARWIADGHELGWPTLDDVDYHLTTLFPPVRLRGWIELRVIDALPDGWWPVAAAVAVALLDDPEAAEAASRACEEVAGAWLPAFREGLSHPGLARAARACFAAAIEAFGRLGVDEATRADAERFYERYVARGRCPADDHLERARGAPEPRDLVSGAT